MSSCASSVYILNDLIDLASDRRHPTKRLRPFASGKASIPMGLLLAGGSLVFGLVLGAVVSWSFEGMLFLAYLVLTTLYSFWFEAKAAGGRDDAGGIVHGPDHCRGCGGSMSLTLIAAESFR